MVLIIRYPRKNTSSTCCIRYTFMYTFQVYTDCSIYNHAIVEILSQKADILIQGVFFMQVQWVHSVKTWTRGQRRLRETSCPKNVQEVRVCFVLTCGYKISRQKSVSVMQRMWGQTLTVPSHIPMNVFIPSTFYHLLSYKGRYGITYNLAHFLLIHNNANSSVCCGQGCMYV